MLNDRKLSLLTMTKFKYFFIILTFFSATWLIANIAAIKLVNTFGIMLTGGFIIFPFTTMLSTVIVEVYGYKNSRQAIWSGFILNLSFVFFISIVNIIPPSPHWKLQNEFASILVPDTRIIFASLISFFLSDFSNSFLMARMKIKNQGRSLIKRIIISYSISFTIDIVLFMLLAFYGTMPFILLIKLMTAAYFKKMICQTAFLPLIWCLIDFIKKKEGIEIYDYDTKFNPFSIDNIYEFTSFKKTEEVNANEKSNFNLSET